MFSQNVLNKICNVFVGRRQLIYLQKLKFSVKYHTLIGMSSQSDKNEGNEKDETKDQNKKGAENVPESSGGSALSVEFIRQYLAQKLGFSHESDEDEDNDGVDGVKRSHNVLETVDFDGLIKHWKEKGFKNVVTMVGAGISTSAGIPDFRSPGTGLYDNLQKYDLPHPTAIFELGYFKKNPKPFFSLAKELYPGTFKPTPCHYFIKLLDEKGLLARNYTQNIDTLERIAGIDAEKLVEAHGTFFTNHCLKCRTEYDKDFVKDKIFADEIPKCECGGVIKPDIVFFGENLPEKFYELPEIDFKKCDLLIIMGTSLEVQPFASLINRVNKKCVRLLVNREKVGCSSSFSLWIDDGLSFDSAKNYRDIAWVGDCDNGVQEIADRLGFGDELRDMIKREHEIIDRLNESAEPKKVVKDGKDSTDGNAEVLKSTTNEKKNE